MNNKKIFLISVKSLLCLATFVQITVDTCFAADDESYSGYESIIKELSASHYSHVNQTAKPNEVIRFHAGVGMITSRLSLDLPSGLPDATTLRGYEARFGIDLFSPNWIAETAVRTFDPEPILNTQLSLREFDLLIVYNNEIGRPLHFNIGGGISARYLDLQGQIANDIAPSNTTPASILTAGISARFTPQISMGAQVSLRSPIVQETIDRGSLDGSIRLSGRF